MNDPDLLREQARAWIDARFDPGMSLRSWLELLADSGWAAPAWPAAWYGKGLPAALAAVAIAEFGAAGVPGPPAGLGPLLAAPTIIAHGTDELKRTYVRAVLTGEHAWCQLFSEPGAGSDLASLATRAERDGEDFVIDGQKVWTSAAQVAEDLGRQRTHHHRAEVEHVYPVQRTASCGVTGCGHAAPPWQIDIYVDSISMHAARRA